MAAWSRIKWLAGVRALRAAQWMFLLIPVILMCMMLGVSTGEYAEAILENPVMTVRFMTIVACLFSYLILKTIRERLEVRREELLLPLWLLTVCQALSLNVFTTALLALGILQEYGSEAADPRRLRPCTGSRSLLLSILPVVGLYGFLFWVRVRLGMVF